jgi:hypothetical protein
MTGTKKRKTARKTNAVARSLLLFISQTEWELLLVNSRPLIEGERYREFSLSDPTLLCYGQGSCHGTC